MAQANDLFDTIMKELNNVIVCDNEQAILEEKSISFHEETDIDAIPPSLLRYFESSQSRAEVCEKLILENAEDFLESHHTEDKINFPTELEEDIMKLKEQVDSDSETNDNKISTDMGLHATTKKLLTPSVSVCTRNEDEAVADIDMESEKPSSYEKRTPEISLDEEESLNTSGYEAEREKRCCEEVKTEEQRRQIESDFQKELDRIMEAEKLHQRELELMEKKAQEKLEQELLLQREVISNLQKQVQEERRRMEEEQKRMKEEDDKRKKEEERKVMEEQRRREEEEERGKIEEEQKRRKEEEDARKKEEERKEEERKVMEEQRRREEEERGKIEEEQKRLKEEEDARKKEEERKVMEEQRRREEEEMRRIEKEQKRLKEEEEKRKKEEERKRQRDEEDYTEEDKELKGYEPDKIKLENENKTKDSEVKQGQKKDENLVKVGRKNVETKKEEEMESKKDVNKETGEEIKLEELEDKNTRMVEKRKKPVLVEEKLQYHIIKCLNEKNPKDKWETSNSSPETIQQQYDQGRKTNPTSADERIGGENQAKEPSSGSELLPVFLPEHTEQKRLSWMKECVPWSRLSLQNKRKQKGSFQSGRGTRRAMGSSSLPPLSTDTLLQSTGCTSLKEVTTVTLEDLPGCSLSSFSQCMQLQSLTLRRCGLKSLEGINQLLQLCYIDVQENDISFVDCENMKCLRVLKLSHNNLTSIHGLTGAENLDTLELSHNSITRIAGLESLRRLQKLSLDHNQLISTKGLRDVYTLLHLTCSHNHLVRVEGLENNALLNTLDLRANSLTEPPSLNNHVLLRELHLEDNSISSLLDLNTCWLPLMQHLSVAQNRITQLPSMSDFVSLQNLDLRFNCLSELQNVCESLEGCQFLRELHLTGNPLQQENGWRSTLRKALPALRATDDQETGSATSLPAVQQVSLASGSFLAFCQAQIQQTHDLELQLCRELSKASSLLGAVKISCRHFTEALQLAEDQRFAHEYGDATVADKHKAAGQTTLEETANVGCISTEKQTETEDTEKPPVFIPRKDNIRCSYWTLEENPAAERPHDALSTVSTGLKTRLTVSEANSGSVDSSTIKEKESSSKHKVDSVSNHQDLNLQNRAAVVIQQMWRKYWQRCGNIGGSSTAERVGGGGGDGGKPESGPSFNNRSVLGQHYAATIIQAVWRGFTLRRRLTSALAAVTCMDIGEDDTFEEVDVDEFVFDEVALEKQWTPLCEDPPHRHYDESEQQLSLQASGVFLEASQHVLPPSLVLRSKQAWVDDEQLVSPELRASPESSNRSKSPASAPVLSGLTERSEKILEEWGFTHSHTALLMLKRAEKMKSKKQQQKKNPSTHLSLFRNCSYHKDPVGAQKGPAKHNRNNMKVGENEPSLQQAEKTEREKQWQLTQAVHSDNNSESVRFLPEISTDILQGGRVQLVADLGYTERQHHASGLWANSSLAARPCRENCYPGRNSLGHERKEVPSPKRVSSAPSKKDRISFRDNPVQLSGGWGGGKKRGQVHK
ncbi:leucine-rich repeat and IQ domain-containing protein 1 [Cheilinus undulatus]|uniref:leucine-rich repeat and IQ domain-containing protein 1 n=1 Tax=Cheilinus undulatus TaxID=241271 RepID=UPI001BD1D394|nr:leucine-rich repeat and IQ domain-containing protein 1 [Cheilinus undulatus]